METTQISRIQNLKKMENWKKKLDEIFNFFEVLLVYWSLMA